MIYDRVSFLTMEKNASNLNDMLIMLNDHVDLTKSIVIITLESSCLIVLCLHRICSRLLIVHVFCAFQIFQSHSTSPTLSKTINSYSIVDHVIQVYLEDHQDIAPPLRVKTQPLEDLDL